MLHILWWILKLIGIFILVILAIILLVCSLVLLHPIHYRISAKADGGVKGSVIEAKVWWFLHLFYAVATYKEQQFEWQVGIFGRKLNQSQEDKKKTKVKTLTSIEPEPQTEKPEASGNTDSTSFVTREEESTGTTEKPKAKWFEKIRCTIRKICDKIKQIWKFKNELKAFLTDDLHVRAFRKIKWEIFVLLKHFRPRKLHGNVKFGFEDPYKTGQVLAGLSVAYPFYGENLQIYPDFEREILEGKVYLKGHIRLVHFLRILKVAFFDREIKRTYQHLKNIMSSYIGGNQNGRE